MFKSAVPSLLLLLVALWPGPARAGLDFEAAHWRLELSGALGINAGTRDRTGDQKYCVAAEYEVPASRRLALGLRLTPLFFYDGPDEDPLGAGAGLSLRLYQRPEKYEGWFAEGMCSVLVHHKRIEANSSNLNFQLGAGIGYQFSNSWFGALRYEHISNSSIGDKNAGANSMGVAIGLRF